MRVSPRVAVVAALPLAAVLVVDPRGLSPFGPAKWAAISTLVPLGVAATWRRGTISLARRPMLAWLAFLAGVAGAAALGVDRWYAWTGTPERHFGAITWLLCFAAFTTGQLVDEIGGRIVASAGAVAAGLLGAWAGAEALGWHPISLVGAGDRPVGTFGSSAYLGAAAALLGPIAIGVALDRTTSRVTRACAYVAATSSAIALVASGARAAWVGALAAGLIVAWVRRPYSPLSAEGRAARAPAREAHSVRLLSSPSVRVVAIVGAAAIAAVLLAFATGVAGRVPDLVSDPQGGGRGRLDEWRVAVAVVARHPLTGVGPEGYRIAFGRSVDARYERTHGRNPLPDRAHDALLDVATTTGVVGLLAYVALLLVVGRFVLRALRRAPPWVAGVAAGLVAYAVQSLFLFPVAELEPVAWLLAGVVVARTVRPEECMRGWVPRAAPIIAAVLALAVASVGALDVLADRDAKQELAAAAAGRFVGDPARPARLRSDAVRYRLVAARAYEARGSVAGLDAALAQVADALGVSPKDPVARAEQARLLLVRARGTRLAADVRRALDALEHLGRDDPNNAEVWLRLGVARVLASDDTGAIAAWRHAEALAPRSAAASTNLAVAYLRRGRLADARAAARRALARDPHDQQARDVLQQSARTKARKKAPDGT
ncbi:MAG: hypothetical protein JWL83_534 [Actinomycetia bacterium]|nr:hypothetical protein [Actinomycetes bacterium]